MPVVVYHAWRSYLKRSLKTEEEALLTSLPGEKMVAILILFLRESQNTVVKSET